MQNKLVLFDIDGTMLVSLTRIDHFEYAVREVFGIEMATVDWTKHGGGVDKGIFIDLLKEVGVKEKDIYAHLPEVFAASYKRIVSATKYNESHRIPPGVLECIKNLSGKVHLGVMSGNHEKNAWHKLQVFGLKKYFEFGVFGHEAENRNELARLVPKRAENFLGYKFAPENIIIIGDTPKDIACARIINARVITAATGRHSLEQLLPHKPDLAVATLTDERVLPFILQ